MASYHGSNHSEPAKMEQIITEFFAKSLHIVLESRCPYVSSRNYSGEQVLSSPSSSTSSSSSIRPRDKWFNLALKDCPAALENIDFWRQSNLEPMVVDVVLIKRSIDWDPLSCSPKRGLFRKYSSKEKYSWSSEHGEFGYEAKSEKIIERWIVQYESRKSVTNAGCLGSKRSNCTSSSSTVYKKSILLLRSLYVMVRLLPAYKLFRELISSAQIREYNLSHRINSFVEPFTRREELEMQKFVFNPVETSWGRLSLSVIYRSSISDGNSEQATPMSPQVIQEYVGSPMADRLKRLPSVPVPQSSPSPFGRRHSWSYDFYRTSPPSLIPSPSPTHSESHALISKSCSQRLPPSSVPRHLPDETPQVYTKIMGFDEYWPSPAFSPSPSPSPPTYILGSPHLSKVLLRSESAPLSIPAPKLSSSPSQSNTQMLPPSPPVKSGRPNTNRMDGRSGLFQTSSAADKFFSLGIDEARKWSGAKISSNSSPQKSFSRSSSRLSFQDDYDDSEFSGPFVVDGDEVIDPGSRPGSFDQPGHPCGTHESGGLFPVRKSQDAAVGALICMLKKAPPLRQEFSGESGAEPSASSNLASSRLHSSKTTADALEELCGYTKMKNLLLNQGKSQK